MLNPADYIIFRNTTSISSWVALQLTGNIRGFQGRMMDPHLTGYHLPIRPRIQMTLARKRILVPLGPLSTGYHLPIQPRIQMTLARKRILVPLGTPPARAVSATPNTPSRSLLSSTYASSTKDRRLYFLYRSV